MNTLTCQGIAHPFSTVGELLELADKIAGTTITHLYRDGLTLVGYDSRPVMYVIGTLEKPVIVPVVEKKLRASQGAPQK